jgi:hypothetical protein
MALREESRLLSIRVLQNFVRETGGQWGWEQWQRLVQRIRRMGFAMITEGHMRDLCERNSERWLSGDNSVEPPEPVEPPALPREEAEPAGYSSSRENAPTGPEEAGASLEAPGGGREETAFAFAAPVARVPAAPTPEERARPVRKAKKAGKKSAKKRAKKKPRKAKKKSAKKTGRTKKARKKPK